MKLLAFFRSRTFSGALSIGKINEENNERDHDECGKHQLHAVLLTSAFSALLVFSKMQERRKESKEGQKQKIVKPLPQPWILLFLQGTCLIKARNEASLVYSLFA